MPTGRCERPLVVRCGAFGDMVLITALIDGLHRRFGRNVDIVTSGPWSEPLLRGQPGVGDIHSVRSRKTPYWLSADQRRVVRWLRGRGAGPTWFCDGNQAARPMLVRAGITPAFIVDVQDHPLLPGEHATQQWRRLARLDPPMGLMAPDSSIGSMGSMHHGTDSVGSTGMGGGAGSIGGTSGIGGTGSTNGMGGGGASTGMEQAAAASGGCHLEVSAAQRDGLTRWLQTRGLSHRPLIAVQIGNKRTMRSGLKRLAVNSKYWPNERWAVVLRHLRQRHAGHALVMLGTGPEYRLNAEVAALAGIDHLYNVADDLPVPRLIALLARADGLVTVDSGPAHVAAAVGCPEVVLFGKASTSLYRPWGTSGADVRVLTGCIGNEPSMLGIETAEVTAAWDTLRFTSGRATCPA